MKGPNFRLLSHYHKRTHSLTERRTHVFCGILTMAVKHYTDAFNTSVCKTVLYLDWYIMVHVTPGSRCNSQNAQNVTLYSLNALIVALIKCTNVNVSKYSQHVMSLGGSVSEVLWRAHQWHSITPFGWRPFGIHARNFAKIHTQASVFSLRASKELHSVEVLYSIQVCTVQMTLCYLNWETTRLLQVSV